MLVGAHEIGRAGGRVEAGREVAVAVDEVLADREMPQAGQGRALFAVRHMEQAGLASDRFEEPVGLAGAVGQRRVRDRRAMPILPSA